MARVGFGFFVIFVGLVPGPAVSVSIITVTKVGPLVPSGLVLFFIFLVLEAAIAVRVVVFVPAMVIVTVALASIFPRAVSVFVAVASRIPLRLGVLAFLAERIVGLVAVFLIVTGGVFAGF